MDVLKRCEGLSDSLLQSKVAKAVGFICRTLDLFSETGCAFSFNGGKDSTVLFHLIRAALAQRAGADPPTLGGIVSCYFVMQNDFPEVVQFIRDTDAQYGLSMRYITESYKPGLESLIADAGTKAILLGTRRGDPNGFDQEVFCPSSPGWPAFMRVNPILDWTYHDVWAFLRKCALPYCHLYDEGYTSLGSVDTTLPNSSLKRDDGTFAPAFMLLDGRLERAGRQYKASDKTVSSANALTRSAALLIIGDELLTGKVEDVNTSFMARELHKIGWAICKVVMVPDDVDAIALELQRLRECEAIEVVITSGGVGPTPDDVTMAGVASALGKPVVRDPDLESRIRRYFGEHVTEAHLKMAEAPDGECDVIDYQNEDGSMSAFPLVRCQNIYVLPGIPHLLQSKFGTLKEVLCSDGGLTPFHSHAIRLRLSDETAITPALEDVTAKCSPAVAVGSYPLTDAADGAGIVVILEGKDRPLLDAAYERLIAALPEDVIMPKAA